MKLTVNSQKWSGAAYTSNVVVPRKDFKVTKGSPKQWAATGDSGKKNVHFFCGGKPPPFPSHTNDAFHAPFPPPLSQRTTSSPER